MRYFKSALLLCGLLLGFGLLTATPSLAGTNVPAAISHAPSVSGNEQATPESAPQMQTTNDRAAITGIKPDLANPGYVLGVSDKIHLTVYGEDDLSGDYEVGSTGVIALPLIGEIKAAELTLQQFETAVREKLSAGYLHDPRVNAQVINYRPFFILGEVSKPGSYPYVNGMNVLNAVALAGGYTYRADKTGATIVRASDKDKKEKPIAEDAVVGPGDIIRVPERFF